MLSPVEDFWLRWHSEHSHFEIAEQARLVLEAESGGSPVQVAANLGLSTQTVQGVLAQFEHDRLATFPRPKLELAQLIQLDPIEAARQQHVVRQARRLFNHTRPLHHLPRKARQLLEAAVWLSPLAQPAPANGSGRHDPDLLDGATLTDYSPREQAILSCVLRLQHKGYRADRDLDFRQLRPADQSQVRQLAALLQVASALNRSKTQSTHLQAADIETEAVVLRLSGPKAEVDAASACRRASLWHPVFHLALKPRVGPEAKPEVAAPKADPKADQAGTVGAAFSWQMSAALRKWPAGRPGSQTPEVAGLGDWLVGVTEAEATLSAFQSVLKRRAVKRVRRPLRALAVLLTAANQQQAALGDLHAYCSGRLPAAVAELQPLREAWEKSLRRQQTALRAWQEGHDASRLYARLAKMAVAAPVRRRQAASIRVAAPVLLDELFSEVAEREASVLADRPKTYRRYQRSLARLASVLLTLRASAPGGNGAVEEADRLLADVQRLQSRIDRWLASSALNDAIAEFLDTWAEQQARRKAPQLFGAQAVLAYRQTRRAQWSRLRSGLPADWRPVRSSRLRRRLDALLKHLERQKSPTSAA